MLHTKCALRIIHETIHTFLVCMGTRELPVQPADSFSVGFMLKALPYLVYSVYSSENKRK